MKLFAKIQTTATAGDDVCAVTELQPKLKQVIASYSKLHRTYRCMHTCVRTCMHACIHTDGYWLPHESMMYISVHLGIMYSAT